MKTVSSIDDRKLTTRQAAEALGVKEQTLHLWRSNNQNDLPYYRVGRAVRYLASDVEAYIARQRVGGKE